MSEKPGPGGGPFPQINSVLVTKKMVFFRGPPQKERKEGASWFGTRKHGPTQMSLCRGPLVKRLIRGCRGAEHHPQDPGHLRPQAAAVRLGCLILPGLARS